MTAPRPQWDDHVLAQTLDAALDAGGRASVPPGTGGEVEDLADLAGVLRAARLDAVLFGGRAADERDLADLARLRADLRRRLRARKGWLSALLAGYGLRVAAR